MSWKASRADAAFSGVRTISEPVEPDASPLPPGAARTKIALRCRHDERGFTFTLPAKGRTPWLSCDVPPQNRRHHVMADMAAPVLQVVSSATHDGSMDTLILRAEGPAECPPGTPSAVVITPAGGPPISVRVPSRDWKLPLPSPMSWETIGGEKPWELPGVHPFCLPDLPAHTWHITLAACPAQYAGMSMLVKAFPSVTWNGQARVQVKAENGPARAAVEGVLTLRTDGKERQIGDWRSLKTIFPLTAMMDDLTRTVNAVAELTSPRHSRGLDSSRLQWREPFRWDPMPSLSVSVESRLFEQPGSGLLGHYLNISIIGEPLAGAQGEAGVLPLLMTNAEAEKRLAPITGGRGGRIAELSTRYGIYLIAEGRCTLRASLRSVRPLEPITQEFLTHGAVNFSLEARSEAEFESLIVSSTAATSASEGCRLAVALEAPPDSPLQEPRDRKPKVQTAFTGLHFHGIERVCGGVRIRPWQPPQEGDEPAPPKPVSLLPARMWPPGSEPGMPAEVPLGSRTLTMSDKLLLHPSDQPVFRLLVDVRACVAEVRINDVPVWSNRDGLACRATLAINEWLFSGDNEVAIHLSAPPAVDAEPNTAAVLPSAACVAAMLLYKKNRAPWLAMQEVHGWNYSHAEDFQTFQSDAMARQYAVQEEPADDETEEGTAAPAPAAEAPVLLHPGQISSLTPEPINLEWLPGGTGLRGGFVLKLPAVWPLCPWARALELSAMPGLDYTVGRLTRSVADSLQRRDWGTLRRLFADRRAALQAAYYLNDASADESLAFPALLHDQTAKVVSPDPQKIKAVLCGRGRLIRAAGETGGAAVTVVCPGLGCQAEIETLWMNNGQEWRLAR